MTQDVYLGRRSRESRVAAALESVDPMASGESVGNLWGRARRHEAVFALVRELARGLEPLTCCFSAGRIGALWPGGIVWRLAW
jgi:hypothetical protein